MDVQQVENSAPSRSVQAVEASSCRLGHPPKLYPHGRVRIDAMDDAADPLRFSSEYLEGDGQVLGQSAQHRDGQVERHQFDSDAAYGVVRFGQSGHETIESFLGVAVGGFEVHAADQSESDAPW